MYVQNPYKYSVVEYKEIMRALFKYKKYLQSPRMCVQSSLGADWDKRNKVEPRKVIRKAIIYGLHETIQDKLYIKDDKYCLVSDESFSEYLKTI